MKDIPVKSRHQENRNSSDSIPAAVPIQKSESELSFKDRLREVIADRKLVSFAKECNFSDSLLGAYLRGEKLPGLENLVAISRVGGVFVDWLATGRPPKTRAELKAAAAAPASAPVGDTWRLAVEVLQEWQVAQGRFLPPEKFMQAVELLVDLADGELERVRPLSAKVLRLVA